ncbi:MAG: hypothetical protein RSB77_03405 [Bacilli bacterium]
MKCPRCGTKLKNDKNAYCIRCGYMDNGEIISKFENQNNSSPRKTIKFINKMYKPVIIVIIILSFGGFFIKGEYEKGKRILPVETIYEKRTADNFINNLYISPEIAYTNLLNIEERKIYKEILKSINNFDSSIIIDMSNSRSNQKTASVKKIYDSIIIDHPELIQIKNEDFKRENNLVVIILYYSFLKDELPNMLSKMMKEINEIKFNTTKYNDYKKSKYIYKWLSSNSVYDNECNSSYNVILENRGSSKGLARASQIIFQNIGITSTLVTGSFNKKIHEWNLIKLDNGFYNFDVSRSNNSDYSGFLYKYSFNYKKNYSKIVPNAYGIKYRYKKDNN